MKTSKPFCRSYGSYVQVRGLATVELALCLPVVVLVCFGAIEGANLLFLRQTVVQSAYEAAKVAIRPSGTNVEAIDAANSVAVGRRLKNIRVQFEPSNVSRVARGQPITVTVSAPGDTNSLLPFGLFRGHNIAGRAVMVKE